MFRPLQPYQRWTDFGLAAALLVVFAFFDRVWFVHQTIDARGLVDVPTFGPIAVVFVMAAALALRRLSPALALAAAWIGAVVQMVLGLPPMFSNIAIFGVLYATAAYGTRVVYWLGFSSTLVGAAAIVGYLLIPAQAGTSDLISVVALGFLASLFALALSWTAGALARVAMRARAGRIAQEKAEIEAASEQQRVRIARDMHDVVAHSLAVVIAQADGARYAGDSREATDRALATIGTTARSALADVRVLLGQLRHSQEDGPQPSIADLEALYDGVRSAGVGLEVTVDPAPRTTPSTAVQLAVYRILQEALTNALRHGDGGTVRVVQAWHADRVELVVDNDASEDQASTPSRGHGLIGMRERAALVGGALSAERDGHRFVVRTTVPLGGSQ